MSFDRDWYKNRNIMINSRCLIDQRLGGSLSANQTLPGAVSTATQVIYPVDRFTFQNSDDSGTPAVYNAAQRSGANPVNALAITDTDACARIRIVTPASGAASVTRRGAVWYSMEGPDAALLKKFPYMFMSVQCSWPAAGTYSFSVRGFDGTNSNSYVKEVVVTSGEVDTFKTVSMVIPTSFVFRSTVGVSSLVFHVTYSRGSANVTGFFDQWVSSAVIYSVNTTVDFWRLPANSYFAFKNFLVCGLTNKVEPSSVMQPLAQEEIESCQRYYEKSYLLSNAPGSNVLDAQFYPITSVSSNTLLTIPFKVTKAKVGTSTFYTRTGVKDQWETQNSGGSITARAAATYTYVGTQHTTVTITASGTDVSAFGHWVNDAEI